MMDYCLGIYWVGYLASGDSDFFIRLRLNFSFLSSGLFSSPFFSGDLCPATLSSSSSKNSVSIG